MNHDRAHQHLSASETRMAALIARSRRYEIKPTVSIRPFDALAESIAYQQLNGKAAATIWSRVRALYPKENGSIRRKSWQHRTICFVAPVFRAPKPQR